MSDYRVTVKIRNARMLRAIEAAGEKPGEPLAKKIGVGYPTLLGLIKLERSPCDEFGYTRSAIAICTYLGKTPYDLWSEEQMEALQTSVAERDVSAEDMAKLCYEPEGNEELTGPEQLMFDKERGEFLDGILETIRERPAEAIRRLYGHDQTLEEAGRGMGVSKERVRNLESEALRILRTPKRAKKMVAALDLVGIKA